MRDQQIVERVGFVDGVWVLSSICSRVQWRVLEVLSQAYEWPSAIDVARSISSSARSKFSSFLSEFVSRMPGQILGKE
jgi:hypothetical protein